MNAPPEPPAGADDADGPARWVLLAGLGVLVLGLLAVVLVTSTRSTREPGEEPLVASAIRTSEPSRTGGESAEPSPSTTARAAPDVNAAPAPAGSAATVTPAPARSMPAARTPTPAAAAAFAESFRPPGAVATDALVVDLEEDGVPEVVVASVVERTARLDVARWDGRAYRVVFTGRGGAAERIAGLHVADVTGDGTHEVWVAERTGQRGASVSMWGIGAAAGMTPLRAAGGCADGLHTYGVVGAEVEPGEIRATCDGGSLPPDRWPVDVYGWDGDRWTWQTRVDRGAEAPR